jgi:DNA-binding transcriptional ArsR family regulator
MSNKKTVKKFNEIHVWDLDKSILISAWVKLSDNFKKKFFNESLMIFKSKRRIAEFLNNVCKKYGINRKYKTHDISMWMGKISEKRDFLPLWAIIELIKKISDGLEELESNIELMEYYGGHYKIKPKFPILVTPELISIIAHLMGDGHVPPRNVPSRTSYYKQFTRETLLNFKQKIKNVFGEYEDKCKSEIRVNIPRIFVRIISDYFEIETFYGDKTKVPEIIKNMSSEFKLAFLVAFMVDEGTIDECRIALFSGNEYLLKGVQELATSLNYDCSEVRIYAPHEFVFYIYMSSAKKLLSDINELTKDFPTCSLCHKQTELERIVKIQERGWNQRLRGESKRLILNELKDNLQTSEELSHKLLLSPSTIRYHLRTLEKNGMVKRIKGRRGFSWGSNEKR